MQSASPSQTTLEASFQDDSVQMSQGSASSDVLWSSTLLATVQNISGSKPLPPPSLLLQPPALATSRQEGAAPTSSAATLRHFHERWDAMRMLPAMDLAPNPAQGQVVQDAPTLAIKLERLALAYERLAADLVKSAVRIDALEEDSRELRGILRAPAQEQGCARCAQRAAQCAETAPVVQDSKACQTDAVLPENRPRVRRNRSQLGLDMASSDGSECPVDAVVGPFYSSTEDTDFLFDFNDNSAEDLVGRKRSRRS